MNYIIFDLEATCDDKKTIKNEIIEIGAIKLNEKLEMVEEFQRFSKPILNPILTDFCKDLTKIKQYDVDNAQLIGIIIDEFKQFIGEDYKLCSWGFYDKKQLLNDCELNSLDNSWIKNHISIKHQHQEINKLKKGVGLTKALSMENMSFDGTHHRGIDDARNISKLFISNFNNWKF